VLVALIILFGFVRPALRSNVSLASGTPAGGQLDMLADDAVSLPGGQAPQLAAPRSDERLIAARQAAKNNPVAVASIVRTWVNGDEA
jgi:flagellar M-ring protein FliF